VKVKFSIPGAPRTKKTHNRLIRVRGIHRLIPSVQYVTWHEAAWRQAWVIREDLRGAGVKLPISGDIQVSAIFWRDAKRGDLTGYMQALGDWLQDVQIIMNDRQIVSWDGTRLDKDAERPRIDVSMEWADNDRIKGRQQPEQQEIPL